jgi:hypothetical protein
MDTWSSGLFVMMAMRGLPELLFYDANKSKLRATRLSALKAIKKVKLVR